MFQSTNNIYIYVYDILYLLSQYYIIYMETKKTCSKPPTRKYQTKVDPVVIPLS